MKIDTILVPTDFSEDARRALDTATELAKLFGSRIILLHAFRVDIPMTAPSLGGAFVLPEGFYLQLRSHAALQVEELAKEAAKEGVKVTGVAIEQAPTTAIIEQAEILPADLIVMGTRGLTGLKHVALGSVAERVVRLAPCDVLTVKAD